MELVLAIVIGALYAAGFYMILRRSIVKLILGLVLISQGANLLIFTCGGLTRANPPLIAETAHTAPETVADPLPQALILTAIVISFGVLAFALVLVHRTYHSAHTDDLQKMKTSEQ